MDWRRSSFSGSGGNCVEISQDLAAVRDSKYPAGPTLAVDVTGFVTVMRAGVITDWRKSSFSGDGGNCVEVRKDLAALRDSKSPGPTLTIELAGLLTVVKAGKLDR